MSRCSAVSSVRLSARARVRALRTAVTTRGRLMCGVGVLMRECALGVSGSPRGGAPRRLGAGTGRAGRAAEKDVRKPGQFGDDGTERRRRLAG